MSQHVPVLLSEVLYHLNVQQGQTVVDATLGAGGYSREILKKIQPNGTLVAFDRDQKAVRSFKESPPKDSSGSVIHVLHENFSNIETALQDLGLCSVDGIVADLGISSDQLAEREKGLSFVGDSPLDMRLDDTENTITAADIVNTYSEEELLALFREHAQEKYARSIVRGILSQRLKQEFSSTGQLVDCIERHVPSVYRNGRIHCATKVFMALRMCVNKEVENLQKLLEGSLTMLAKGGRMVIVTFHSVEDRMVKEFIRKKARGCVCPDEFPVCRCGQVSLCKVITSKPVIPTSNEIDENPRSRSAKLRVLEKVEE